MPAAPLPTRHVHWIISASQLVASSCELHKLHGVLLQESMRCKPVVASGTLRVSKQDCTLGASG